MDRLVARRTGAYGARPLIVCLSRAYGAAGGAVARVVAHELGYRLIDDELPQVVAARLGTTVDVVSSVNDRQPGFGERILAGFGNAVPETAAPAPPPDADVSADVRREIERLVRIAGAGSETVIVGRAAGAILGARPDVVRGFITAALEWRIGHLRDSLGMDAGSAEAEIKRIDAARRAWVDGHGARWDHASSYDVAVDTGRLGVEGAAATIVTAVRAVQSRRA